MDCSLTADGYFELKGYMSGQWESDISQNRCAGQLNKPTARLAQSSNHVARFARIILDDITLDNDHFDNGEEKIMLILY